jgi:fatty acid desaturase
VRVKTEAQLFLFAYAAALAASIVLQTPFLLFVWIIPALIGQPFLRAYLLAEHGRCPNVSNMFENTRTTYTTAMVRFIAWNMPYHAEHHAYPNVPFHRLPQLHKLAVNHLKTTENGYGRFHQTYAHELKAKSP